MKTIITSQGDNVKSKFDLRFGRAGWFCIYDPETKSIEFIENENKNAQGGAGTKTAEMVAELGAKQVVSGDFGPKAKSLLERFKIQMILLDETNLNVQEVINKFHS
ncbi:MAG: NifB/NifX family molybdenum-iron cluster-binding protein [Bacteroidota bacterium]